MPGGSTKDGGGVSTSTSPGGYLFETKPVDLATKILPNFLVGEGIPP